MSKAPNADKTDGTDNLEFSDALVESTIVTQTPVHIPGMALETAGDRGAREDKTKEKVADTRVKQSGVIDTHSPEGNLRTRDNIVREAPAFPTIAPAAEPVVSKDATVHNGLTHPDEVAAARKRDARAQS